MRNTFFKVGMVENFLNLVKSIDRKPAAKVILNNENVCCSPKSISNTSILPVSIDLVWNTLANKRERNKK